jgi:hypothetical protein
MMGYDAMKPYLNTQQSQNIVRNIRVILGLDNGRIDASKRNEGN